MLTLIRLALWLACLGLWGATLAGMTAPLLPPFELFNHFRHFLIAGGIVLAVAAWPFGTRALRLAVLGVLVLNIALAAATFRYAALEASDPAGPHLRVMTMNIWGRNREIELMRDEILKQAPDVIVFQEFRSYHQPLLDGLRETMPYQQVCDTRSPCGLAMASRIPWTATGFVGDGAAGLNPLAPGLLPKDTGARSPPLIWADFEVEGRAPLRVYGLHLAWPFDPLIQRSNIDWLIEALPHTKVPYVIAGDFNLSPWSWKLNQLAMRAGLNRHVSFALSWPMHRLFPFVLIDNVLATPDIANISAHMGGRTGSDHAPLVVDLSLAE
jgi:endonuclease/exonuclease/phosphatase (EEP) superfamily protein YafD